MNKIEKIKIYEEEWLLSANTALLGMVYPELRMVSVGNFDDTIIVRFYIDREVSEFDSEVIDVFTTEFLSNMGLEMKEDIKCVFTKDSPIKLDTKFEIPIFARMENKKEYE